MSEDTVCARPGCGRYVPVGARGPVAKTCSDACRKALSRARRRPVVPVVQAPMCAAAETLFEATTLNRRGDVRQSVPLDALPDDVLAAASEGWVTWQASPTLAFTLRRRKHTLTVSRAGGARATLNLTAPPRVAVCDACGIDVLGATHNQRRCAAHHDPHAARKLAPYSVASAVGVRRGERSEVVVFRVDGAELWRGGDALTLPDVARFACRQPRTTKRVAWSFPTHGATALLSQLPDDTMVRLATSDFYVEVAPYWYRWSPGAQSGGFFAVSRSQPRHRDDYDFAVRPVRELFKNDLAAALAAWDVGTEEERGRLRAADAGHFLLADTVTDARVLAALQVRLVRELMTAVEATLRAAGVKAPSLSSAGGLAAYLMRTAGVAGHLGGAFPAAVRAALSHAVVGGRSEGAIFGRVQLMVDHDVRAAYAAALATTPCTADGHGEWTQHDHLPDGVRSLVKVAWRVPAGSMWGPLPYREADGGVWWPREGVAWVFDGEARAAQAMYGTAAVCVLDVWTWHPTCTCPPPFSYLTDLFALRATLDTWGPGRGDVVKLALTATHGLLLVEPRPGRASLHSPLHYALVTSDVRAQLLGAIASAPDRVIAVNVDGLHCVGQLDVSVGPRPGEWKTRDVGEWFAAGRGRGWTPDCSILMRAQGLPLGAVREQHVFPRLAASWDRDWTRAEASMTRTVYVTLGEAVAQRRPDLAGTWQVQRGALTVDVGAPERVVAWVEGGAVGTVAGQSSSGRWEAAAAFGDGAVEKLLWTGTEDAA